MKKCNLGGKHVPKGNFFINVVFIFKNKCFFKEIIIYKYFKINIININ
jgi:hypothetical protein